MFIRWKKRLTISKKRDKQYKYVDTDMVHHIKEDGTPVYYVRSVPKTNEEKINSLSAYLCTSVRINGKPRQKATFLASIRIASLAHPRGRLRFWQDVQKRIAPFNLSYEQQARIKAKLLECVPDVTREEIAEADKRFAENTARLHELLGRKT